MVALSSTLGSSLVTLLCLTSSAYAQKGVPNDTFVTIAAEGIYDGQRAVWEQGTAAQAILEYFTPKWSHFAKSNVLYTGTAPTRPIRFGYRAAIAQMDNGRLGARVTGDETQDSGSGADSCSNGESVILGTMWSGASAADRAYLKEAARKELVYITELAPRASTGLISHRAVGLQAWSDSVYMSPPFIAYYGQWTQNQSLLMEAYNQIRLYRDVLQAKTGTGKGLWAHNWDIDRQKFQDGNMWLTGQGWVVAGICRVLSSIAQSPFNATMAAQKTDLINWGMEVVNATFPLLQSTNLFNNYANNTKTFQDASGSMLMAYSVFRLTSMAPNSGAYKWIGASEKIYNATSNKLDIIGNFQGVNVTGVLSFSKPGKTSIESLGFALLMSAARRDYYAKSVVTVSLETTPPPVVASPPPASSSASSSSSSASSSSTSTDTSSSSTSTSDTSISAPTRRR